MPDEPGETSVEGIAGMGNVAARDERQLYRSERDQR